MFTRTMFTRTILIRPKLNRAASTRARLTLLFVLALHLSFGSSWSFAAPIQIGGFFSTGMTDANTDNPVFAAKEIENKTNYLADTVFGLQLDTLLSNETRFSAQLVARDKNNSFDVAAEWLFVSHQLTSDVELRAGRLRIPMFLTSETLLVGQSYDWVRPPLELYGLDSGLSQYNGFSTVYRLNSDSATFEGEFYLGQVRAEINILGQSAILDTDQLYGSQITVATDNLVIRASASRFKATISIATFDQETKASLGVLGFHYSVNQWGLSSEVARIATDDLGDTTGYYLTGTYTHDKLMPLFTYAGGKTKSDSVSYQGESYTLGVKYHLNGTTSYKLQVLYGEVLDGRSLLLGSAPPGFDEKVTVYSMSLNLTF